MVKSKKTLLVKSFFRSQFASILATAADFLITIFFTEVLKIWYVVSTACGAFTGAVISFILGRNWVFNRKDERWIIQAVRYILTAFSSMGLNTAGVYFLTDYFGIQYVISKIIVATLVGVFFNFFMFRYFVFK